MNVPSFRPSRAIVFSLLVVSILATKLLHLFQHIKSVPVLEFIIYFPTFFVPDVLVAVIGRVLLQPGNGFLPVIGLLFASFLAIVSLFAASSQLGFFYVTGAEMQWEKASSVATDATAVKLMLTGIVQVSIAGMIILVFTWLATPWLYNLVGHCMWSVWKLCTPAKWDMLLPTVRARADQSGKKAIRIWPFCFIAGFVSVTILLLVRPSTPYNHISTTLPWALLGMVGHDGKGERCTITAADAPDVEPFPLSELVDKKHWQPAKGNFKGWAPDSNHEMVQNYKKRRPEWLLETLPDGFFRWEELVDAEASNVTEKVDEGPTIKCSGDEPSFYNPVSDPLRISNLDSDIYEPLKAAFANDSVQISHIVFVMMESARKELFPFQEGNHLHKSVLESFDEEDQEEANLVFSKMTPVAEQVTGESFWSNSKDKPPFEPAPGVWRDSAAPGMGGLNVKGAMSGSSLSFKSVLNSHCGVFPLPVDFLEEVTTKIYQPCLPNILNLFNQAKDEMTSNVTEGKTPNEAKANIQKQKWRTLFVQSTTDTYDRQGKLNSHMGIEEAIVKETIEDRSSKYYPPKSPELNYFGYPDTDAKPMFKDAMLDAVENNTRLFISHFTSSTHHPWKIPDDFNKTSYTGPHGKHGNMDKYMNTIHYDDFWIGEILGLLDETGIANETLVIMVGDHGQAFEEDAPIQGTYKNGHISNYRVPIVLRHPHLPRINIEANVTSMTILPTVLDLLINTKSLDSYDMSVAKDLIHDYEGQSLLRPFRSEFKGRQAWNFAIINAGGKMLAVSSAATHWRVIIPLEEDFTYTFSDLETDPNETDTIEKWSIKELLPEVRKKHGEDAAKWLEEAEEVTRWWSREMHRRWNYESDD